MILHDDNKIKKTSREVFMSCYFRHMKDIFETLNIEITSNNKKTIDQAIHNIVGIAYKDCSATWKKVKEIIRSDDADKKNAFVSHIKKELGI
jgi:hypothetical protein